MRRLVLTTLGAGLLTAAASLSTPAQAMPAAPLSGVTAGIDLVTAVQWRRNWGGRNWGGPRTYGGPRYYGRRNNVGPAIGAGVLGLATGASSAARWLSRSRRPTMNPATRRITSRATRAAWLKPRPTPTSPIAFSGSRASIPPAAPISAMTA